MTRKTTVMLLAGGQSSRFWPLQEKNLFWFLGKPLLAWHYEQLLKLGLVNLILVTNSQNRKELATVTIPAGLKVEIVLQEGSGQAQAIFSAQHLLAETPLLVLNSSDLYADTFLVKLIEKQKKNPEQGYVGAVKTTGYFPGGYLRLNAVGSIVEIVEKPPLGNEPSDTVRVVADLYPSARQVIEALKPQRDDAISGYEKGINQLITQGLKLEAVIASSSEWKYLKYPWHVLDVTSMFLHQITKQQLGQNVKIAQNVILEGPMIIEDNVKISDFTKIVGPCYIGKNTIIGNNNIIRTSHIGSGCVTGFNTDIARSYIGDNCWFHSNYIGDSVLEENVSLGSGTVLANLRLDEREITTRVKGERVISMRSKLGAVIGTGVRIGVNSSIMPGIKIGSNSLVGAGVILDRDLDTNGFCLARSELVVTKNKLAVPNGTRKEFKKEL